MAADRIKILYHSISSDKKADEEINEYLESLGDVEIIDISIIISNGLYAKIWYRPNPRAVWNDKLGNFKEIREAYINSQ